MEINYASVEQQWSLRGTERPFHSALQVTSIYGGRGGRGMNGWLNKWKQHYHQQQQQHKEANHSAL